MEQSNKLVKRKTFPIGTIMIWESHPVMEEFSLSQIIDITPQNDYEDDPGLAYKVHFFDEDSHMLFNEYDFSGFIRTYVTKIIYPDGVVENVENERANIKT